MTGIVGMNFGVILTTVPPRASLASTSHSIAPRPIRTVNCGAVVISYIMVGEWKNTRTTFWIVVTRYRII